LWPNRAPMCLVVVVLTNVYIHSLQEIVNHQVCDVCGSEIHSAMVPTSRDRRKMSFHVSSGSNSKCLAKRGSAMMNKSREPEKNSRTCVTCNQMCVTEHTSGYVKFWLALLLLTTFSRPCGSGCGYWICTNGAYMKPDLCSRALYIM
jgi:hypothetical protein